MINMQLANERKLSDEDIKNIIYRQKYRETLAEMYTSGKYSARLYQEEWTANEFELQKLWGFPEDQQYHKFWKMQGCTCPKMDNEDAYPTGFYVNNGSCPLHGHY